MGFFANILSFLSMAAGLENSKTTVIIVLDEPEFPRELLD